MNFFYDLPFELIYYIRLLNATLTIQNCWFNHITIKTNIIQQFILLKNNLFSPNKYDIYDPLLFLLIKNSSKIFSHYDDINFWNNIITDIYSSINNTIIMSKYHFNYLLKLSYYLNLLDIKINNINFTES